MILEKSWQSGDAPGDWKMANIVPIFKKKYNREADHGSYWPVNLTSVPGNIMVQILLEALLSHVEDRAVFQVSQYGFAKKFEFVGQRVKKFH